MLSEGRTGLISAADGSVNPLRSDKTGALVVTEGHGKYTEATLKGKIFHLTLPAWTTDIAAGNLDAAAAAASTQFALWNPLGSGVNLVLLKFMVTAKGKVSGGVNHSYMKICPTIANVAVNPPVCGDLSKGASCVAGYCTSAAGATLTGGSALLQIRSAGFFVPSDSAALGSVGLTHVDNCDGDISIPPGYGWVPTWTNTGGGELTGGYSVTWEEIPII